ncbi:hypothetical protein AVEN_217741-1 [Araneus ventricosus]|uniref:Uncharacterized protein n=1 Tax=Araneus ventricosus TaxID=182803 RepID=A0A4Y2UYS8_ARAVE|nr:hypothetical protein AVEN_217741-1 [Araneus ventricosus]
MGPVRLAPARWPALDGTDMIFFQLTGVASQQCRSYGWEEVELVIPIQSTQDFVQIPCRSGYFVQKNDSGQRLITSDSLALLVEMKKSMEKGQEEMKDRMERQEEMKKMESIKKK